jgi:filamentous hemagglutinin family protein
MRVVSFALAITFTQSAHAQTVVADGATLTGVTADAAGHVTIDIAEPDRGGVSLNSFLTFNVGPQGLDFDNRVAAARTIVSEVTGSGATQIAGAVEVLGQRAHLIIANPNGITVDGGRFINTGGVALAAGDLSLRSFAIAPGRTQTNAIVSVSDGRIEVGPGGLTGAMDALYVLARQIRVSGAVTNENASPFAEVNLVAGQFSAEFDSAQIPRNDLSGWANIRTSGSPASTGFLIDIERQGNLRASQINIRVTDQGAGVRFASEGLASRGEFTLSADGRIDLSGAIVRAAAGANIQAGGDVRLTGEGRSGQVLAGSGNVEITSQRGNILVEDTRLAALSGSDIALNAAHRIDIRSTRSTQDAGLFAEGDFVAQSGADFVFDSSLASIGGNARIAAQNATFESNAVRGGFFTDGSLSVLSRGTIEVAGARIDAAQVDFESAGAVTIRSLDETRRGVVFAFERDLSIRSASNLLVENARLVSNRSVNVAAGGDIRVQLFDRTGSAQPVTTSQSHSGSPEWWTLWTRGRETRSINLQFRAAPQDWQDATITAAQSINFEAGGLFRLIGGDLNANTGDVVIDASGIAIEGYVHGSASYTRECLIVCSSRGSSSVGVSGGRLNAAGDVRLAADTRVLNLGGTITGLSGVEIRAPDIIFESYLLPNVVQRRGGLSNFWSGPHAYMFWTSQFGGVFTRDGTIGLFSDRPVEFRGLVAPEGMVAPAGVQVTAPVTISPVRGQNIGLFSDADWLFGD